MHRSTFRSRSVLVACLAGGASLFLVASRPALAHLERDIASPPRTGAVPDESRVLPNEVVVCKPEVVPPLRRVRAGAGAAVSRRIAQVLRHKCKYEHIQDAVNAAGDDTTIKVLPGVYREEPSRGFPETSRGDLPNGAYSYEFQVAHPHDQNLIAIFARKNLTLEGVGGDADDVVIDAGFVKDVGVRCDRCEGFIIRNLTVRDANEHGIYVLDSDGYVFDRTIGAYSLEYQLFSFASDHGLYHGCEALGGGDSGIYVGAAPNTPGRMNTVVRNCKSHHNVLGYSGTNSNYVMLTQNDFYDNAIGISFDSEREGHANFPQNHSMIVDNDIHDNNFDIYAATSDVPPIGLFVDFFHIPVGTGIIHNISHDNLIAQNRIWGHNRFGVFLVQVDTAQGESGGGVMTVDNRMGVDAGGAPNGVDFWWDGFGDDNCWQNNGTAVTSAPQSLPSCGAPNHGTGDDENLQVLIDCLIDDPKTGQTAGDCPFGTRNHAPKLNRDQIHQLTDGGPVGEAGPY